MTSFTASDQTASRIRRNPQLAQAALVLRVWLIASILDHSCLQLHARPAADTSAQNLRNAQLYNKLYYEGQAVDDASLSSSGSYFEKDYRIGIIQHIWDFYPDR